MDTVNLTNTNGLRKPVIMIILDGFGINLSKQNNAVAQAQTPHLDDYFAHFNHTPLNASGAAVGLPDGQMGNSEVGHFTMGCGSILPQDIVRIDNAIKSGEFFRNPALLAALQKASAHNKPLHLLGLVSDGGVHSHLTHLKALIHLCKQHRVAPLLHMITDGRDTGPKTALRYLSEIEPLLHESGGGVASVMGRYFAMDRDTRWERTEIAWRALVLGKAQQAVSAQTAILSAYAAGDTDEFIRPIILPPFQPIEKDTQLISFNFRKDRPRQIVSALGESEFGGFDRGAVGLADVTCMMRYDVKFKLPFAYQPEKPAITLAQIISNAGLRQFHCAETEKYAHVTYFFNGGRETPFSGETRLMVPSPSVATYDQKPSMSAAIVADKTVEAISANEYSFIVVNFANGDMVGHTAVPDAVIEAVETLDREVARVIEAAITQDYSIILTADHGNCELLIDPVTRAPHTQHTTFPVPFLLIDEENWQLSCAGGLSNIAPTILQLMGLNQPETMTATSLLLQSNGKRQVKSSVTLTQLQGAA